MDTGRQLAGLGIDPDATRPGEARDETSLDRVYGDAEDDRDRSVKRKSSSASGFAAVDLVSWSAFVPSRDAISFGTVGAASFGTGQACRSD